MDTIDLNDIEEAFRGKLWAFTPVCRQDVKIGIAVANEAGFSPVPYNMTRDCGERYDEQKAWCAKWNTERGQTEAQSLDIVCSSMAAQNKKKAAEPPAKWKATYESWSDEEQRYLRCSFYVLAKSDLEAEREAEKRLAYTGDDQPQAIEYINLSVEQVAA